MFIHHSSNNASIHVAILIQAAMEKKRCRIKDEREELIVDFGLVCLPVSSVCYSFEASNSGFTGSILL
ncbi:hypothetical protein Tco_0826909 [Tanacetum coccineum]